MVLRAARWELSSHGIARRSTLPDSSNVGSRGSAIRGVGRSHVLYAFLEANHRLVPADSVDATSQARSKRCGTTASTRFTSTQRKCLSWLWENNWTPVYEL